MRIAQIIENKSGKGMGQIRNKIGAVAAVTFIMCIAAGIAQKEEMFPGNEIIRPGYDEGERQIDMNIGISKEGEKKDEITVGILLDPKKLTREEAFENLERAGDDLPESITGGNISLDNVSGDLQLITTIPEYRVTVEWYSSDYDLIDYDGTVNLDNVSDEGTPAKLTAIMKCGDFEAEKTLDVKIVKPKLTEREKLIKDINDAIKDSIKKSESDENVRLPDAVNGYSITYSRKNENNIGLIVAGGVLATAAVILSEKESERKAIRQREKELQYAYSEVVSKLTLLIGAGMSVQRAWAKISEDYETEKRLNNKVCYAYEEMLTTWRQLKSGVSERTAYREFGRRCKTKEYRKLGTLLEQNVKKGTKGLSELLEQESSEAFEQRKNLARQMGEEAGTKLLLPMILMLAIVMVIVMVPAIMSFQI